MPITQYIKADKRLGYIRLLMAYIILIFRPVWNTRVNNCNTVITK